MWVVLIVVWHHHVNEISGLSACAIHFARVGRGISREDMGKKFWGHGYCALGRSSVLYPHMAHIIIRRHQQCHHSPCGMHGITIFQPWPSHQSPSHYHQAIVALSPLSYECSLTRAAINSWSSSKITVVVPSTFDTITNVSMTSPSWSSAITAQIVAFPRKLQVWFGSQRFVVLTIWFLLLLKL